MKTKMNTCEDCKKITSGLCDKHINGMTFEQFKKSICDKDPQVKWALDLIDEEVKEALQQQREEILKSMKEMIEEEEFTTYYLHKDKRVKVVEVEYVLSILNPPQNGESKK